LKRFHELLERKPFRPHPLIRGGHLQTILGSILPRNPPWGWTESREEFLDLDDGARVRVVIVDRDATAPTLVLVHGLGGSSDSTYMRGLSHKAYRRGWNSVLLNLYDSNLRASPPRIFHAGSSDRLANVIDRLSPTHPRILLTGISLGGNMLLKMLGEQGGQAQSSILAAAVISPLTDLTTSWSTLDRPSNRFFRYHYLKGLRRIVRQKEIYLRDHVDLEAIRQVRTIRQFDEVFTAPLAGYRDAMEYYIKASAAPLMKEIQVPTLLLHSKDDPLLPYEPLLSEECRSNPYLTIGLTERGGHVGFVQAAHELDRAWAENRALEFLDTVLSAMQRQDAGHREDRSPAPAIDRSAPVS